jgi:SAM-dependent methyltransferase
MEFDLSYTKYWEEAVQHSVDGTVIAGPKELAEFLWIFNTQPAEKILDLGCSTGRMYPALLHFGKEIVGIDPDPYAIKKAKKHKYSLLRTGTCESSGFHEREFDLLVCWAVFDCVNQELSLVEMNRILTIGGSLLVTGKNDSYLFDDSLAFTAEKNAYLKDFPNNFTNLPSLINSSYGFKVKNLVVFEKRGDMGNMKYHHVADLRAENFPGYEFLVVLEKTMECKVSPKRKQISSPFSRTAEAMAISRGFDNASSYFESLGRD